VKSTHTHVICADVRGTSAQNNHTKRAGRDVPPKRRHRRQASDVFGPGGGGRTCFAPALPLTTTRHNVVHIDLLAHHSTPNLSNARGRRAPVERFRPRWTLFLPSLSQTRPCLSRALSVTLKAGRVAQTRWPRPRSCGRAAPRPVSPRVAARPKGGIDPRPRREAHASHPPLTPDPTLTDATSQPTATTSARAASTPLGAGIGRLGLRRPVAAAPARRPLAPPPRAVQRTPPPSSSSSGSLPELEIEGVRRDYCNEFECTSSPAVEQAVRQLARDVGARRWTARLFQPDVKFSDGARRFTGGGLHGARAFWPEFALKGAKAVSCLVVSPCPSSFLLAEARTGGRPALLLLPAPRSLTLLSPLFLTAARPSPPFQPLRNAAAERKTHRFIPNRRPSPGSAWSTRAPPRSPGP